MSLWAENWGHDIFECHTLKYILGVTWYIEPQKTLYKHISYKIIEINISKVAFHILKEFDKTESKIISTSHLNIIRSGWDVTHTPHT